MGVVDVRGLTVELADRSRLVDDVTFSLQPGEIVGVVGESGSGKSTLSLAMLGHVRRGAHISGGEVNIDGTNMLSLGDAELRRSRRSQVTYVPQDPAAALNPAMRIGTQLREVLSGDSAEIHQRVASVLRTVDLPDDPAFLKRRPRQLSGGQQQRVAIAMAVVAEPGLTVLDEPTTGLDVTTQSRVLSLVSSLCSDNQMTAIYVSHDLAVISEVADRVLVMYGGQVVEQGKCEDVVRHPTHPYTRALLGSAPSTRERLVLQPIPGRAPAPHPPVDACVFAPRCQFAIDECRTAVPPAEPFGDKEMVRCIRARHLEAKPGEVTFAAERDISSDQSEGLLDVDKLRAGYGDRTVLFDVSMSLAEGECVAIVGESGSGKTTMSQTIVGIHERQSGEIRLRGRPLAPAADQRSDVERRELQYVFQNPYGSLNPRRTIGDSIGGPLKHFFGLKGSERRQQVRGYLDRVELPGNVAGQFPAQLSGGQRQRAAIARALACDPTVLVCDEVTSALDVSVQAAIVELLRSLLGDGLSMVFVTHNLAVVRSIADAVMVLSQGQDVEHGVATRVLDDAQHPYTQSLLRDTPQVPIAASTPASPAAHADST